MRIPRIIDTLLLGGVLGLVLLLGAGCVTAASPAPPADDLLRDIADATDAAGTLTFQVQFAGTPTYVDPEQEQFALVAIAGQYVPQQGEYLEVQVQQSGARINLDMLTLRDQSYITNPLTREWLCLPAMGTGGVAVAPTTVLNAPLADLRYVAETTLADAGNESGTARPVHHLHASIAGDVLQQATGDLLGQGTVAVDLYADTTTQRLRRVVLTDTGTPDDFPTVWTIDISDYGAAVTLTPPRTCP